MKKLTAMLLAAVFALSLCVSPALADAPAMSGTAGANVTWNAGIGASPAITFSGTGPMDDYDDFSITHDWNRYFNASIVIEAGITHVGGRSFGTGPCTSATIASTVESIGSFAFSNCKSLAAVRIDNPNITIEKTAFNGCGAIGSFVVGGVEYDTPDAYFEAAAGGGTLPDTPGEKITWSADGSTLTFSGKGAIPGYADAYGAMLGADWYWSYGSADLVIGEGITRVGDYAFAVANHPSVTMAASVESIGSGAFQSCNQLKTVKIDNPNITFEADSFKFCKITSFVVAGKEYGTPEEYIEASKEHGKEPVVEYVALAGTTAIDDYAFQDCKTLEAVVLPEGVTTIGASAFIDCTNLRSVTLPSTLTAISAHAFQGCTSLQSIRLPDGLEVLGEMAFYGCTSLTSVTIPKSIASWGNGSFAKCTGLTQVTLTQGLTLIGNAAFSGCSNLRSVTLPDSMVSIGSLAFRNTGLTGVTIPRSVTYLGNYDNAEYAFGVKDGADGNWTWVTDFTITGYAGTEAENYANSIGFPFVDLTPPAPAPAPVYPVHIHSWDSGVVTVEPTELTGGLRVYTCRGCRATRTESISAGWAAPIPGISVPLTGTPTSGGMRIISSVGVNPDVLGGDAYAFTQNVEVDGAPVEFQMYALRDEQGNYTNYVKLRDVALVVNGTAAQCNVDWLDGYVTVTTRTPYKPNGSEMKTPFTGDRGYSVASGITKIDGKSVQMQAFVLFDDNNGGYTYYKLRDLGQALGFNVGWSLERGVYMETDRPYDDGN